MNKTIITLAVSSMLVAGSIFTSCKSPAQKEDAAQSKVEDAQQDLNEAQDKADAANLKVATAEEWTAFKNESEIKIRDNEVRIAELKAKMKKPGKVFDSMYEKRIDRLEEQNRDMQARIDAYEKSQSNWETFKTEFNHDMDELGKALKDLTVDNK
jgi:DNA repair ATPase RecN